MEGSVILPKKGRAPASILGGTFFNIEGMGDRFKGPRRRKVYGLIGRLCNRLGYEPVVCAVNSLKKRLEKGELEDPLRYLAGAAERVACELQEDSKATR